MNLGKYIHRKFLKDRGQLNVRLMVYFFLVFADASLPAQVKQTGVPFIHNFHRRDYNASSQNWAITQDKRGIIYVGNNDGVLEYDGYYWNQYTLPNRSVVRSLACSPEGTIFVGGSNEFGFLAPDSVGKLSYRSIASHLPEKYRNIGEVWRVFPWEGGMLFQTFKSLIFYKDSIKIISSNQDLNYSFLANKQVYLQIPEQGIFKINKNGNHEFLKGSKLLNGKSVTAILPLESSKLIIATRDHGLYLYSDNNCRSWITEANEFALQNQVFNAIRMEPEFFALGSVLNGLIIINKEGKIIQHINKLKGLQNNTVLGLFYDMNRNLWLGLDNGIDFVKTNSPVSTIDPTRVLGAGYTSVIYNGILYLGTNQGLYSIPWEYLKKNPTQLYDYKTVDGVLGQVWELKVVDNTLLCGHDRGVFQIVNEEAILISRIPGGWKFLPIEGKPGYLLEGTYTGFVLLKRLPNQTPGWQEIKRIGGFDESCREIIADKEGGLWVSHGYKGVYKIELGPDYDTVQQVKFYNASHGLPSDFYNTAIRIRDDFQVSSLYGIYSFNESSHGFKKNNYLSELFGKGRITYLTEDSYHNLWYFQENQLKMMRLNYDGTYQPDKLPFDEFKGNFISSFENIHFVDDQNILISSQEGFMHFDAGMKTTSSPSFQVLLRCIKDLSGNIIFGGFKAENSHQSDSRRQGNTKILIPYSQNSLQFEFSCTYYEKPDAVVFAIMLAGSDQDWSEWSDEHSREYTRLREGDYIFKIKGKSGSSDISETNLEFTILPPWYRSISAYFIYTCLILLGIYLFLQIIRRKINREKEILRLKQRKELERQQKEFENETLRAQQEIFRLTNEKLQAEVEKNKTEIDAKSRELASITMQISYKNELLNAIKLQLQKVSQKMDHEESRKQVLGLVRKLDNELIQDEDWEKFEIHFDQVHENFLKKLKELHPSLKPKDLKICAYLRMNLSSKEIAPLLNISVRGVEISRYRLRRKMNLSHDHNLIEYLMSL